MGKRSRIIAAVALLLAAVLSAWALRRGYSAGTPAASGSGAAGARQGPNGRSKVPLGIRLATVQPATLSDDLRLSGNVVVAPERTASVSPRVQGQVIAVLVNVGDRVRAGQLLATIRSQDIAAAQAAYRQAEAQVHFARLALEHQKSLAHLGSFSQKPVEDARSAVNTAQAALMADQSTYQQDLLTAQQDQASVLQDQSAQRQDEMDRAHDRAVADRQASLFHEGVVSRQDYETSQLSVAKDEEKVASDRMKVGADELKVSSDRARAAGDESRIRADENQLRISQSLLNRELKAFGADIYAAQAVEQADSSYRAALLQLQQTRDALAIQGVRSAGRSGPDGAIGAIEIRAPLAGVITSRNVNPGMNVDTSTPTSWQMFTISNLDVVNVSANVYDRDLDRVRPGAEVQVVSPVSGLRYYGRVAHVSTGVDPQTHTIRVFCDIRNPRGELKDGMYVDVTVLSGRAPRRLTIPASALRRDAAGAFVFVPAAQGYAKQRVTVGKERADTIEVRSGLKMGDRVVSDGSLLLSNGDENSGDD